MFICGSGSFSRQDEDEYEAHESPCPTPKRSKRSTTFCKIIGKDKSNKNRFSDRGLDKFYALLADLEKKKQSIYTQVGIEDISLVQFVYKIDSDQAKSIVVRANKEKKADRTAIGKSIKKSTSNISHAGSDEVTIVANQKTTATTEVFTKEEVIIYEKPPNKRMSLRCKGSFKMDSMRQPYFYLVAIIVLVLVFLAIYGRSFAIFCTSIVWYMVPTVVGGSSSSDSSSKRKLKNVVMESEGSTSPTNVTWANANKIN